MTRLLALLLAAAPAPAQTPPPAPPAAPAFPANAQADRLAPLEQVPGCGERALPVAAAPRVGDAAWAAMRAFHAAHKGLGLLVLHDGRIDREAYDGITAATRTQTASMNKTVTALMAGAAIADRLMPAEDRPLRAFNVVPAADPKAAIPLRAFLTMSSGIRNAARGSPEARALMTGPGVTATALAAPVERPLDAEFRYNNANSQIVGAAIQAGLRPRGESYAAYLSRRLWCPLGNAPATLWTAGPDEPRFYAGLNANLRDWARVGELIRRDGRVGARQVIPAAWIARMATPSRANPNYGYQIWRGSPYTPQRGYSPEAPLKVPHAEPYRADDVLFLDGFGGQRVYIVPSAKLVIARTGETDLTYDDSVLVNLALDALAGRPVQQSTPAKP